MLALVDADAAKVGEKIGDLAIESMDDLSTVVRDRGIKIGIIATPAAVAQEVADQLVAAGVCSILNFAPAVVAVPDTVSLRKVDLAIELQILSFYQSHPQRSRRQAEDLVSTGSAEPRPSLVGYPVNLLVAGRRCLVVGAGRIAARKIESLLAAGADLVVVAPEAGAEVRGWAGEGRLTLVERAFEPADVDGAWLVVTATDVPEVNRAAFEAGEARRIFVNSADDPANCSFTLMSVVRRGDIVVSIGTNGRSPALATYLKEHVRDEMGPEYGTLLELLSEAREEIRATGRSSEDSDWRAAIDSGILELIREGRESEARELLRSCL